MSNGRVALDLIPGEAFFRVSIDDEGTTSFACGLYPTNATIDKDFNPEDDVDPDDILTVFMAGIASLVKDEMDYILHSGTQYLIKGERPFDFIVSPQDAEYFDSLTDEQLELLNMDTKGEA